MTGKDLLVIGLTIAIGVLKEIDLDQIEKRKIEIRNSLGENRIVIKDNMVYMEHADCPDQYCVKHKAISKTNETIVCLPHKLVVELHEKKTEEDFDSIVQ